MSALREVAIKINSQPGSPKGFAWAQSSLGQLQRSIGSIRSGFLSLGASIVAPFAVGKIVGDAMSFEKEMSKVYSIFLGTKQEARELGKYVKEMAINTGRPLNEVAAGAYQTISSGFQNIGDIKEIMRVSSIAAKAGATELPPVIDAITTSLDNYGMASTQAMKIADLMNVAVREGKTTFGELSENLGHVIAIAPKVGVSFEELMAATARMTKLGGMKSTPEVMTQLANVMKEFITPGEELQKLTAAWGYESSSAAMKGLGLVGVIKKLNEATNGNMDLMGKYIPDIRALKGVLGLTTSGGQEFYRILDVMNQSGGTTNAMLEKFDTNSSKITKAMNAISIAGEELGAKILPKIAEGIDSLGGITGIMDRASAAMQAFDVIIKSFIASWDSLNYSIITVLYNWAQSDKFFANNREKNTKFYPKSVQQYLPGQLFSDEYIASLKEQMDNYKAAQEASQIRAQDSFRSYEKSAYDIAGKSLRRPVNPIVASQPQAVDIGGIVRDAVNKAVGNIQNQIVVQMQTMDNYVIAGGY